MYNDNMRKINKYMKINSLLIIFEDYFLNSILALLDHFS